MTLPELKGRDVALRIYHDDDAEVYLNGVPAGTFHGYTTNYEVAEIPSAAIAALKPGRNVIAIHCHQVHGGQYIDAGLEVVQPAGK